MTEIERARRLLRYDAWANLETIHSMHGVAGSTLSDQVQQTAAIPPQKLVSHIIGAEWNWLARVLRESPRMAIWPEITQSDLERSATEVQTAWRVYLDAHPASELNRVVTYTNSKGAEFHNTVADIITHLAVHSEHHRGQIAQTVRGLGGLPAATDFIQYARKVDV